MLKFQELFAPKTTFLNSVFPHFEIPSCTLEPDPPAIIGINMERMVACFQKQNGPQTDVYLHGTDPLNCFEVGATRVPTRSPVTLHVASRSAQVLPSLPVTQRSRPCTLTLPQSHFLVPRLSIPPERSQCIICTTLRFSEGTVTTRCSQQEPALSQGQHRGPVRDGQNGLCCVQRWMLPRLRVSSKPTYLLRL